MRYKYTYWDITNYKWSLVRPPNAIHTNSCIILYCKMRTEYSKLAWRSPVCFLPDDPQEPMNTFKWLRLINDGLLKFFTDWYMTEPQ